MAGDRAISIFKEDLDGSIEVAKAAAQRLGIVAVVLGRTGTVNDLVPYIAEKVKDPATPDEVLYRLAEQLDLVKLIGGLDPVLVAPLETLCVTEETLVRDAATKTINSIVEQASPAAVLEHLPPMINRLCGEGVWFTGRVSVCRILAAVYAKCEHASGGGEAVSELRKTLMKLCADESPMVRRAAAVAIGEVAAKAKDKAGVAPELRSALRGFASASTPATGQTEADSVRVLAVASLPAVAKASAGSSDGVAAINDLANELAHDKSWKIRSALATHLPAVASNVGSRAAAEYTPIFAKLQGDPEPEVGFVAAKSAGAMAAALPAADVGSTIAPHMTKLVVDMGYRSPQDRAMLAAVLVELLAHCDPRSEPAMRIVTEASQIISSTDESPFVRIQLIESSPKLVTAIGHQSSAARDVLAKLIRIMDTTSASAPSAAAEAQGADGMVANQKWCWRLRFVVSEVVSGPEFLDLGVDFYRDHLAPIVRMALVDPCMLVRVSAITGMGKWAAKYARATSTYGQWADENLVSTVVNLRNSADSKKSYLLQLTTAYALEVSAAHLSADGLSQLVGVVKDKDATSDIPNMRIAAARCLGRLHQHLDFQGNSAAQQMVTSTLQKLSADPDIDVKSMAQAALSNQRLPLTFPQWGPEGAPWVVKA